MVGKIQGTTVRGWPFTNLAIAWFLGGMEDLDNSWPECTSAHLAILFTNIRELSGPPVEIREWRRFVGSTD